MAQSEDILKLTICKVGQIPMSNIIFHTLSNNSNVGSGTSPTELKGHFKEIRR